MQTHTHTHTHREKPAEIDGVGGRGGGERGERRGKGKYIVNREITNIHTNSQIHTEALTHTLHTNK